MTITIVRKIMFWRRRSLANQTPVAAARTSRFIRPNRGAALHGTPPGGATLLHMYVDFDEIEIARWLIEHVADVNARAEIDADGFRRTHPTVWVCGVAVVSVRQAARRGIRTAVARSRRRSQCACVIAQAAALRSGRICARISRRYAAIVGRALLESAIPRSLLG